LALFLGRKNRHHFSPSPVKNPLPGSRRGLCRFVSPVYQGTRGTTPSAMWRHICRISCDPCLSKFFVFGWQGGGSFSLFFFIYPAWLWLLRLLPQKAAQFPGAGFGPQDGAFDRFVEAFALQLLQT